MAREVESTKGITSTSWNHLCLSPSAIDSRNDKEHNDFYISFLLTFKEPGTSEFVSWISIFKFVFMLSSSLKILGVYLIGFIICIFIIYHLLHYRFIGMSHQYIQRRLCSQLSPVNPANLLILTISTYTDSA